VSNLRILYVGESWLGSCARSLKEALSRRSDVSLDEINEDHYFPSHRAKWLRALHRLARPAYVRELTDRLLEKVRDFNPDFVIIYKGYNVTPQALCALRALGTKVINIYPDCSPKVFGEVHANAVGICDLVISTKVFHPPNWRTEYGYQNQCVFVAQGYDPNLHLVESPPAHQTYDIVLVATCRPYYLRLAMELAALLNSSSLRFAIGGSGWQSHAKKLPPNWSLLGPLVGRSYVNTLRQGKICIAPLSPDAYAGGALQRGDEDTTRTYELAAARCFFIHQRSPHVSTVYDESTEVPFFSDVDDLATKINYFLRNDDERIAFAKRAQSRVISNHSLDHRATEIVQILRSIQGSTALT
jgi:Glycosyl transferases group 1